MPHVAQSRRILIVSVVSCLFVARADFSAGQRADQAAAASIVGSVTILGGFDAIGDVEVTVVGPMEGQAKAALASFPLMAVEIAERLSIPRFTTATGADGRFVVQNLAPGLYSVLATRKGYVGPAKPGDPPTSSLVTATITVAANERGEVLLSMVPGEVKPQLPFVARPQ